MTCRVVCSLLLAIVAGLIQGTIAVPEFCSMEPETGNCEAAIKRWFFNSTINTCETFIYGGCGGNDNNFEEREVCERKCRQCPVYDCPMDSPSCPNGYKKDEYGCQTCECRTERGRPCMNHKCGSGEKCMDTLMVPGPHCINIKENKKMCNRVCMDFCNKRAPMIVDLPCPLCNCPEDACKTMLCREGETCESEVVCKGKSKCRSKGRCARNSPCEGKPEWSTTYNANKFCGRGPNQEECSPGYECVIAPNDAFAVCCPRKECPVLKCKAGPDGHVIDDNGCKTCQCITKPSCKEMPCPEGETCVETQIHCITTPCDPIFECKPYKVCPALPPGNIGTCDEACGSDSDCAEGEKCCSNGCGHHCMTAVDRPCEGKPEWSTTYNANKFCGRGPNQEECSPGYECVIAANDAFAVCCPRKECPALKCKACPDGHVIDDNGCKTCQCITKPSCKEMPCPEGETCVETRIHCITTPCDPIFECKPHKVCPALPPGNIGTCDEACGSDSDCAEGEKCCSNGCGHHCMTAVDPTGRMKPKPANR